MTLVSVVIPAFNAAGTIGETIDSVLGQTFKDYEVIVVDDGSTDRTAEIVDGYGDPVRRLSQRNLGVSTARNAGIAGASGRYLAILDADDLWVPTKLHEQVKLLDDQPDVGMCFVGATRVDATLGPIGPMPARHYADYCEALLKYSVVISAFTSSAMFRREVIQETGGFDPEFSQCADWDLAIRCAQAVQIAPIDKQLVMYRTHAGRMSSDIGLLERDTFAVLDKFFRGGGSSKYASQKRRIYSNHWMILAGSYLEEGSRGDAVRCLFRGLRTDPSNLRPPAGLPWRRLRRGIAKVQRSIKAAPGEEQ